MKRASAIALIITIVLMMTSVFAFAEGAGDFTLKASYPENGQKNTTVENMSVKLKFTQEIDSKGKYAKQNQKCFTIKPEKGKKLPLKVLSNPKNKKEIIVLVDVVKIKKSGKNPRRVIRDNTKYQLIIDKNLRDNRGVELKENKVVEFKTINQSWNTRVYMVMMIVMMIAMFGFMAYQAKRSTESNVHKKTGKSENFNPYKEAKKTGKSIEEVMAKHEKERSKKGDPHTGRSAKDQAKFEAYLNEFTVEEKRKRGKFRVKGPHRISDAGSSFVTGRKAEAEARRAKEAKLEGKRRRNAGKAKK